MCRKSVTEGSAYTVNEAILAGDVIDDVLTQEHFLKIAKVLRPKGDQERLDLRCTCNEGKGVCGSVRRRPLVSALAHNELRWIEMGYLSKGT